MSNAVDAVRSRVVLPRRALGFGLAAAAAVFASSAGVLLRQVGQADVWTVLVYRSAGFVLTVLVFIAVCHGSAAVARFREIGRPGLLVAGCLGGSFIVFVFALATTNVAIVLAVLGVAPMAAALLGWRLLGERPSGLAWLAMAVAAAGVSTVVWDGLRIGAAHGVVLSAIACLGYAGAIVGLRAGSARDMSPAICLSGVIAGVVSLVMADTLAAPRADIVIGLLLGVVQIGAQYILLTVAARFASAADIAMVMILEVVLAPLWVWLFVGEPAPVLALGGGAIVVGALALNGFASYESPGRRRVQAGSGRA